VGAEPAREHRLAPAVVPREQLDQTVEDLVAAVTAPLYGAVAETKALLQSARELDLTEQRRVEREAQVRRFRELAALMGQQA
jgi:enoyl-CoA hydratase/carnithine racemase